MNLTKELQEELIQVANERAGYECYGLDHKTDHMKTDLFSKDMDGYSHAYHIESDCSTLIERKTYALNYISKNHSIAKPSVLDPLKGDITALENLREEVQNGNL